MFNIEYMQDIRAAADSLSVDDIITPFAHLTDLLPDGHASPHVKTFVDWFKAAGEYIACNTDEDPGKDMLPVLLALASIRDSMHRALGAQTLATYNGTIEDRVAGLTPGCGLVTDYAFRTIDVLLDTMARTVFTNICVSTSTSTSNAYKLRTPIEAISQYVSEHGNKPLPMLFHTNTRHVWRYLRQFYVGMLAFTHYPGSWDGCDIKTMHAVVYRWLVDVINHRYSPESDGFYQHILSLITALAVHRPHIYPILVGVQQWIFDNAKELNPRKTRMPVLHKDIRDMQALASAPLILLYTLVDTGIPYKKFENTIDNMAYGSNLTEYFRAAPIFYKENERVKVSYFARPRDILTGRRTKTTPGRFLNKVLEVEPHTIKAIAESVISYFAPPKIEYISDLNPTAWSEAYLNARGFKSCMMPKDVYDPVYKAVQAYCSRAFAPSDMVGDMDELALAVLRTSDTGQVVARSIVNKTRKQYVRVYGDDRLQAVLEKDGYTEEREALAQCYLYLAAYNDSDDPDNEDNEVITDLRFVDCFYCPYLDGGLGFIFGRKDPDTWCYAKSMDGILIKLIDRDTSISCIPQGYIVYRGDNTGGYIYQSDTATVEDFNDY